MLSNKTAKGLVSLIAIIIVLSSILAGTIYYQSNITANAVNVLAENENKFSGRSVGMERVSGFDV